MHILIVEDDARIGANLYDFLESRGHQCEYAATCAAALTQLGINTYDALVLDIGLPDGSGLDLVRHLRQQGSATGVLMLTARDTLEDKLAGFDAGTDDYLVKPFALKEVEARLQVLHRRSSTPAGVAVCRFGPLQFNEVTREVRLHQQTLRLPPKGLLLLALLLRHPRRVFSRREIELAVWGHELESGDNLRSLFLVLRRALSGSSEIEIENIHGLGYRLVLR